MSYSPKRSSGRHRGSANRSTELQNLILRMRRARRVCRPHLVVFIRFFIVLFTIIELKPMHEHFKHEIFSFLSRLNVLVGIMAGVFSIIFFDVKAFSIAVVACIFLKCGFDLQLHHEQSIAQVLAWVTFHASAVLFSMLVGRRRSIIKPMVVKANAVSVMDHVRLIMKNARNVDILEAGIRIQAAILAVDYALSLRVGVGGFMFTLPFACCFLLGYSVQKNGMILLCLLALYSVMHDKSPILGFSLVKTTSTLSAAILSMCVGPGGLTIDEWIARSKQLCY